MIHRILDTWSKTNDGTSAADTFDSQYRQMREALAADAGRRHFAELSSTVGLQDWKRLKAFVTARCERIRRFHARPGTKRGDSRASLNTSTELSLQSGQLRLRGNVDRIRRLDEKYYEVRDYKTGHAANEDGSVKQHYALQLRAYGLLVREHAPAADVRLIVDDGDEREVDFDVAIQESARKEIAEIVGKIPMMGNADASTLASPGAGCFGCNVRHVCSDYLNRAPRWWRTYPQDCERIPSDVWGTVHEIVFKAEIQVLLVDEAGRRVRIDGLDQRHGWENVTLGSRLWFFDLETTGSGRGFDGKRFQPRSFHEMPRDRRERRAWTTTVFCSERGALGNTPMEK